VGFADLIVPYSKTISIQINFFTINKIISVVKIQIFYEPFHPETSLLGHGPAPEEDFPTVVSAMYYGYN